MKKKIRTRIMAIPPTPPPTAPPITAPEGPLLSGVGVGVDVGDVMVIVDGDGVVVGTIGIVVVGVVVDGLVVVVTPGEAL